MSGDFVERPKSSAKLTRVGWLPISALGISQLRRRRTVLYLDEFQLQESSQLCSWIETPSHQSSCMLGCSGIMQALCGILLRTALLPVEEGDVKTSPCHARHAPRTGQRSSNMRSLFGLQESSRFHSYFLYQTLAVPQFSVSNIHILYR